MPKVSSQPTTRDQSTHMFQFRLRTLFAVILICGLLISVAMKVNWWREDRWGNGAVLEDKSNAQRIFIGARGGYKFSGNNRSSGPAKFGYLVFAEWTPFWTSPPKQVSSHRGVDYFCGQRTAWTEHGFNLGVHYHGELVYCGPVNEQWVRDIFAGNKGYSKADAIRIYEFAKRLQKRNPD